MKLGDMVESALSAVGITSERVESWIGAPCGCARRKARLNRLSDWAAGVLGGEQENAVEKLEEAMKPEPPPEGVQLK